jgi:hypothetical protein
MSEQQPKDPTFEVLQSNDAAANSYSDSLSPVLGSEFFHDAFDVHLYGFLGDFEALANIAIPISFGDSPKDIDFTIGKRLASHVDRQILGKLCRKMLASAVHLADDSDQLVEWGALEQIAARSCREGALDFIIALKCRHNDRSCLGKLGTNGGDGADSAHVGKP